PSTKSRYPNEVLIKGESSEKQNSAKCKILVKGKTPQNSKSWQKKEHSDIIEEKKKSVSIFITRIVKKGIMKARNKIFFTEAHQRQSIRNDILTQRTTYHYLKKILTLQTRTVNDKDHKDQKMYQYKEPPNALTGAILK
ncbi:9169_t:CDS:2, partial [Gigaspora rosea]